MCETKDVGVLGLDDECCGDDPDDCEVTTVEGRMLQEACDEVIYAANLIREFVDEPDYKFFPDRCADLTIAVGELVRQVIEYIEPDAGMEDIGQERAED